MFTRVCVALVAIHLFCIDAAIIKKPAQCSTRPCTYVLDCASASCTAPESSELQAVLDDSEPGDTIQLTPGKTWRGVYTLTSRRPDAKFLTITSSEPSFLPSPGRRITPAYRGKLPVIELVAHPAVLRFPIGPNAAHHVRLLGLEIRGSDTMAGNISSSLDLIRIGEGAATSQDQLPNHIEIDRCYVHGSLSGEVRNGIVANGRVVSILNSYFSEIKFSGIESHAVVAYNTPGPISLINNYLEAASIPVLIGGGPQSVNDASMMPGGITIEHNYFYKPLKWFDASPEFLGKTYMAKNMLEFKIANSASVRWNVFEQNFHGRDNDQSGQAIAFNVRLPNGLSSKGYAATRNVRFENNIVRGSLGTFSILGTDAGAGNGITENVSISNNAFLDIGCRWDSSRCASQPSRYGRLIAGGRQITVRNNTMLPGEPLTYSNCAHAMQFDGTTTPAVDGLEYAFNVVPGCGYLWKGDGLGIGSPTINAKTTGVVRVTGNTMPGWNAQILAQCAVGRVCTGNLFPTLGLWTEKTSLVAKTARTSAAVQLRMSDFGGALQTLLGADFGALPQILGLTVSASSKTADISWQVSRPVAASSCTVEVSENKHLISKAGPWEPIPDVNPTVFPGSDSILRPGNFIDGERIHFVLGASGRQNGIDRSLAPGRQYYFRVMCGGDTQTGTFITMSSPSVSGATRF